MAPGPFSRFVLGTLIALHPGALAPEARAQQHGSISGTIRAAGDEGPMLEGARIVLLGTTFVANSNRLGEFSFHGIAPGKYTLQASAIGYAALSMPVEVRALQIVRVVFEATPEAAVLPDVEVTEPVRGTMDFLRRRTSGRGRYFTRAQIEKRNPATIADLMRMVPGLRVDCRGVVCRVTSLRGGRNCVPAYYMDGIPTDPAAVWMTPPRDLEGIEIYTGPSETPPELEHRASCGAIVLWTRLPPERVPKPRPADTAGAGAATRS